MATIIHMPKLSDTMTVGTLVRWLKQEGEALQPGDMLAEVETDKATMEVENFDKGILIKQYIPEGTQVAVGEAICALGEAGEAVPAVSGVVSPCVTTPSAEASGVDRACSTGSAPLASIDNDNSLISPPPPDSQNPPSRIKISPLARKLAQAAQLDPAHIQGSGPRGRIVKADVLAKAAQPRVSAGAPPADAPLAGALPSEAPPTAATAPKVSHAQPVSRLEARTLPLSGMRQTIARRLLESKTQIPHFYLDMEVNAAPLAVFKAKLDQHVTETKITLNDIILKATAKALEAVPAVNVSFTEKAIQQHGRVHLAFGVAVDEGLLTPVIRDAQSKSLIDLSLEAKALIAKAKAKKLSPQEMTGSTFTVTNLGMFGVYSFLGIINPPNAGILSVGAAQKQAVVNEAGQIVPGERMHLGFSGDHRAIDGALAAQFLKKLKDLLENPLLIVL